MPCCWICKRWISPPLKTITFRPRGILKSRNLKKICNECFEDILTDNIDLVTKMFEMRIEHRLILKKKEYLPPEEEKSIKLEEA